MPTKIDTSPKEKSEGEMKYEKEAEERMTKRQRKLSTALEEQSKKLKEYNKTGYLELVRDEAGLILTGKVNDHKIKVFLNRDSQGNEDLYSTTIDGIEVDKPEEARRLWDKYAPLSIERGAMEIASTNIAKDAIKQKTKEALQELLD